MKEIMKYTWVTFEIVMKAIFALLYESNSEAIWINKMISGWINNPIWKGYWNFSTRVAETNAKIFAKLAA